MTRSRLPRWSPWNSVKSCRHARCEQWASPSSFLSTAKWDRVAHQSLACFAIRVQPTAIPIVLRRLTYSEPMVRHFGSDGIQCAHASLQHGCARLRAARRSNARRRHHGHLRLSHRHAQEIDAAHPDAEAAAQGKAGHRIAQARMTVRMFYCGANVFGRIRTRTSTCCPSGRINTSRCSPRNPGPSCQ